MNFECNKNKVNIINHMYGDLKYYNINKNSLESRLKYEKYFISFTWQNIFSNNIHVWFNVFQFQWDNNLGLWLKYMNHIILIPFDRT